MVHWPPYLLSAPPLRCGRLMEETLVIVQLL